MKLRFFQSEIENICRITLKISQIVRNSETISAKFDEISKYLPPRVKLSRNRKHGAKVPNMRKIWIGVPAILRSWKHVAK